MRRTKIGIATIVALNNYGAVFQSYALIKKLEELGYSAEIIDFREPGQDDCNMFVKVREIKDIFRNMRKIINYSSQKKRLKLFSEFVENNLLISPNYFLGDLKDIENRYDILCTGSDQTFNINLNAFKKEFFLNFNDNLPKMSYASSFGEYSNDFTIKQREWMKEQLLKYKYISIREKSGVDFAKSLTSRNDIVNVLDPTLLLSSSHWKKICDTESTIVKKKYILFYSVLSAPWVVSRVKEISQYLDLPVVVPHLKNQYEIGSKFDRITECGPSEFLNLIANAELILTTSFHATVFSFQFRKPFYSFILGEGNRIGDFLKIANLENREIKENDNIKINLDINYDTPVKLIDIERKKSISYLENTLAALEREEN